MIEVRGFDMERWVYMGKGIASISIWEAGAYSMEITDGATGIGWVLLVLLLLCCVELEKGD